MQYLPFHKRNYACEWHQPPIPTLFLSLIFLYSSVALLPQVGSLLGWSQHLAPKQGPELLRLFWQCQKTQGVPAETLEDSESAWWWPTPLDTRKACQRKERRGRNSTPVLLEDPVRGIRRLTISTTRNRLQGPVKPNHPLGVNWRSWLLKGKNWSENRDSFDLGYLVLGYVTHDNYHGRCQSYLLGICTWSSPIKTNYMGGFFCSSFHKGLFPITQTFEPEPSFKTRIRPTTFKC